LPRPNPASVRAADAYASGRSGPRSLLDHHQPATSAIDSDRTAHRIGTQPPLLILARTARRIGMQPPLLILAKGRRSLACRRWAAQQSSTQASRYCANVATALGCHMGLTGTPHTQVLLPVPSRSSASRTPTPSAEADLIHFLIITSLQPPLLIRPERRIASTSAFDSGRRP